MNRNLLQIKTKITDFWKNRSKLQKILLIGIVALAVILSIIIGIVASSNKMVPLYKDLSAEETGQIKQVLDEKVFHLKLRLTVQSSKFRKKKSMN